MFNLVITISGQYFFNARKVYATIVGFFIINMNLMKAVSLIIIFVVIFQLAIYFYEIGIDMAVGLLYDQVSLNI